MKRIVYYVASSIDGFIAGVNEDVSGFIYNGPGPERYIEDLKSFQTVIMGRNTYEFGYKFGAIPGEPSPAYPHMKHYVFSDKLVFKAKSEQVEVKRMEIGEIERIKETSPTDIYLCGGGHFAGWLLKHKQIDILKIKLNPLVLGSGVKLFEDVETQYKLEAMDSEAYSDGLRIISYKIIY